MGDFRTIERELAEYFRREGVPATECGGDVFIGVCTPKLVVKQNADNDVSLVDKPSLKIVSLTRLARELAESVH
jgi:hypothetical protein